MPMWRQLRVIEVGAREQSETQARVISPDILPESACCPIFFAPWTAEARTAMCVGAIGHGEAADATDLHLGRPSPALQCDRSSGGETANFGRFCAPRAPWQVPLAAPITAHANGRQPAVKLPPRANKRHARAPPRCGISRSLYSTKFHPPPQTTESRPKSDIAAPDLRPLTHDRGFGPEPPYPNIAINSPLGSPQRANFGYSPVCSGPDIEQPRPPQRVTPGGKWPVVGSRWPVPSASWGWTSMARRLQIKQQ